MVMKNRILERVDEAIETMKPIVENRMPYRKWSMNINLLLNNTFDVMFEYKEDLSDKTKDGKIKDKYWLCNQFWYSEAKPDVVHYKLIRYMNEKEEEVKTEEIVIGTHGRMSKPETQPKEKFDLNKVEDHIDKQSQTAEIKT